jgi:DNA-binding NarL/FixJ family response regulator
MSVGKASGLGSGGQRTPRRASRARSRPEVSADFELDRHGAVKRRGIDSGTSRRHWLAARTDPLGPPALVGQLTPREREVIVPVAPRLSHAECAERLCVTEATVKSRVGSVRIKLALRDRVRAVVFACGTASL